jgi:hypothetical protein
MSKSKPKTFRRNQWDDYEDDYNSDYKSAVDRRKEKQIRNLVRSKNVQGLMEIDHDDGLYDWGPEIKR